MQQLLLWSGWPQKPRSSFQMER